MHTECQGGIYQRTVESGACSKKQRNNAGVKAGKEQLLRRSGMKLQESSAGNSLEHEEVDDRADLQEKASLVPIASFAVIWEGREPDGRSEEEPIVARFAYTKCGNILEGQVRRQVGKGQEARYSGVPRATL